MKAKGAFEEKTMKAMWLMVAIAGLSGCGAGGKDDVVIQSSEPNRVSGVFERDGVVLAFDFARNGEQHVGELRDADGRHLVSSVLTPDHETLTVLGGRLVISGAPGSATPEMQGDPKALEQLDQVPELALFGDLKDALEREGVDRGLFRVGDAATPRVVVGEERAAILRDLGVSDEAVVSQASDEPALQTRAYWGSDRYWHIAPGETISFGTKGFWATTEAVIRNYEWRCATAKLTVGFAFQSVKVPGYNVAMVQGQWWAAILYVTNMNSWIAYGSELCGPGELGVFTR